MAFKTYTFTFASGATGTNKLQIGAHSKMTLVLSNVTAFNAGAGNASITVRGGLSATDVHADIPSCTVSTTPVKGLYPMPYNGAPFMSIGFGTAVTGTALNTVDLLVYNEVGGS